MCWIFHETLSIWLPIRCPLKKIEYASWKDLKICLSASKRWLILTNSVRCFDHCGDVLVCLLINTNAPSHWLKSVAWPVGPVLKFRDIPDCSYAPNTPLTQALNPLRPKPLAKLSNDGDTLELPEVSEMRIFRILTALYPSQACGQDKIPNRMLKEYAEVLSFPISRLINLSLKEKSLLKIWKSRTCLLYQRWSWLKSWRSS